MSELAVGRGLYAPASSVSPVGFAESAGRPGEHPRGPAGEIALLATEEMSARPTRGPACAGDNA
jgi:hypothetical protein